MKIHCLLRQGRRDVITIYLNDEPWKDVHAAIFGKAPNFPQSCSTEADFLDFFHKQEFRQAKRYALNRLAAKSYASHELTLLMKRRLISEAAIKEVIAEFLRLGYFNDQEIIENFGKRHIARGVGPKVIAMNSGPKGYP